MTGFTSQLDSTYIFLILTKFLPSKIRLKLGEKMAQLVRIEFKLFQIFIFELQSPFVLTFIFNK